MGVVATRSAKGNSIDKRKGRPREAIALFPVMRTNPGGGRLTMSFEYKVSFPKFRLTQWNFAGKKRANIDNNINS
jgi:hypothetical protein